MKRRNQSGQMTVEAVLLIALFVMASSFVANFMKTNGTIRAFVSGPWLHLQGMVEHGVWGPPDTVKVVHPNVTGRQGTVEGDK